jgi:NAD(P)-dependent dehydrogenase (short-subunit alcohol dehydrogenase family)
MEKILNISGKTALITGAAKRLGSKTAHTLADEGVNIIVHYNKSEQEAKELSLEIKNKGVKSWTIKADFDIKEEYESLIDRSLRISNNIDILINNASIFPQDTLDSITFENLSENIRVNTWVPLFLNREFSKKIKRGAIINMLDTRTKDPDTNWHLSYNLSKNLLETLTKMLALKFAPDITVNGIAPGLILPPEGKGEEFLKKIKNTVPLNRTGISSDISQAMIFLLKSEFITGQVIYVDGGRHLNIN